ncbi:MAG: hypothetical protein NUV34_03345 [Sulfuricaulis sp.]|nr:hypothetical protein [Sulfuricaulis sp.]
MESNVLLFILGQIVTGAAIWGAIRADIRNMMVRMNDIKADLKEAKEATNHAHKRIDDILNGHSHSREGNGR